MSERDHAIMEAPKITASDEHFAARPQIDCNDRRKVYEAGFQRAWTEAQAESAAEIADLRRQLEDARKDTGRYRWLRDNKPTTWEVRYWGKGFWHCATDTSGSNLDAAIDAAMKDAS